MYLSTELRIRRIFKLVPEAERRILNSFISFLLFIRKGEKIYNKQIQLQKASHVLIFGSDPRTQKNMRNNSLIYLSRLHNTQVPA